MSWRRPISLACLCALLAGLAGGCGGGERSDADPDETVAEQGAPSAERNELSSRQQFLVAKARDAIGETVDSGRPSEATRQGVQDLIRVCRRDPDATYGARTMLEVVWQGGVDLDEAAPALAERLRHASIERCE